MIAEDLLERGLADAANEYDVPPDAVDRVRQQLLPSIDDDDGESARRWTWHRPTTRGALVLAAAALVLVIVVAFAVGGGTKTHNSELAGPASAPSHAFSSVGSGGGASSETSNSDEFAVPAPSAVPLAPHKAARVPAVTGSRSSGSAGTTAGGTTSVQGGTTSGNNHLAPLPSSPDKVIKTGELDLQAPKGKVSHTLDLLTGLATFERGYVADSRSTEGGFAPSGQVTLRVPVAAFEDTVKRARNLDGVKVLGLQTSGKDVTSKFVDLKARISALKKTRNTFLDLLARATTIGETLAVQQHVTDVQTQIEQLKGQKKVIFNQAALSTLTVTVDQKLVTHTTPSHHKSGLHKAVDRSVSRFVHGIEAIIGIIGPLLLVALIVGLGWLAARFGYRRLRRRLV